jgi:RNA polymerase sigma-70 factor (ECF subfamily)
MNHHLTEKAQRDYELVKSALEKGDQQAYAELMKNYRDALYFMLLKMTNNPQDADDLTIEAFGKAFKNLNQYTPNYAFSTWLFRIASNNCIDFMRRKRRTVNAVNSPPDDDQNNNTEQQIPSDTMDPEESMIRDQKIETMHAVVEKLKPHYRKLIELRYFKEYSYEEIANEMNLPIGTVKAQLFRAREFLSNLLQKIQEKI